MHVSCCKTCGHWYTPSWMHPECPHCVTLDQPRVPYVLTYHDQRLLKALKIRPD